jgi:hypothetical protein
LLLGRENDFKIQYPYILNNTGDEAMRFASLVLFCAVVVSSCNDASPDSDVKADTKGRRVLGRATPYHADIVDSDELRTSISKRRELAWKIFSKIIEPVNIAADASGTLTAPRFITWYERQEIWDLANDMFSESPYDDVGFDLQTIEQKLQTAFPPITVDPGRLPIDNLASSQGGGMGYHGRMGPTLFSEGMLRHYLLYANSMIDCIPDPTVDLIAAKKRGETRSFSPCMAEEFPRDAVMLKALWEPIDAVFDTVDMIDFPTDAEAMESILGPDSQTQIMSATPMSIAPSSKQMFIVRDRSGAAWALKALHVVTKEVDEWVWATFWWSPEPNTDFGVDRPDSIRGSWSNYKMCAQSDFMEQDVDPTGGVLDPGFAAAMQVVTNPAGQMQTSTGTAGWCANPFVEGTFARSTCIGCHQAAGSADGSGSGNTLNVKNFPGDFSFAFEMIRGMMKIFRDDASSRQP